MILLLVFTFIIIITIIALFFVSKPFQESTTSRTLANTTINTNSLVSDPKTLGFKENKFVRYEDGYPLASPSYVSSSQALSPSGQPLTELFTNSNIGDNAVLTPSISDTLLFDITTLPIEKQIALSDARTRAKYFYKK